MDKRLIAKIAVISTVAVMAFGLFSMAVSMEMGMGHCPVMRTTPLCANRSGDFALFDHHVDGFHAMTLTTAAVALLLLAVVFVFFRIAPVLASSLRSFRESVFSYAHGPPSPIGDVLCWVALHNKTDLLAPVRVHAFRA